MSALTENIWPTTACETLWRTETRFTNCSPYRVPIARLAAAQPDLKDGGSTRNH